LRHQLVTKEYAREIGADGHGKDAVSAVRLVEELQRRPEDG